MNAKTYLQQIRKANIMIDYKQQELDRLRILSLSISSGFGTERVQTSNISDKVADTVSKIIDLGNEITENIDKYVDLKREVMRTIDKLDDSMMIELLYKRYFEFKTWEQIACEMNYSCQWVWKLHGEALKKVNDILRVE